MGGFPSSKEPLHRIAAVRAAGQGLHDDVAAGCELSPAAAGPPVQLTLCGGPGGMYKKAPRRGQLEQPFSCSPCVCSIPIFDSQLCCTGIVLGGPRMYSSTPVLLLLQQPLRRIFEPCQFGPAPASGGTHFF